MKCFNALTKLFPHIIFVVFGALYFLTLYWDVIKYEIAVKTRNLVEEKWVLDLPPPASEPQDAVWQPVGGTRYRFYVYSAYVERRSIEAIRIIAATKTYGPDPVVCQLWLSNNRTVILPVKIRAIRENWNFKYTATYILCLLRDAGIKPQETVGANISVIAVARKSDPATNMLTVLNTEPQKGLEEQLHVCVKPFYDSYESKDWLIEWFEINRLLGVNHFYMYNESLSAPVSCLLEHYKKQGLLTLLSWKLPFVSKVEIRTEGLFAAFNDCLYRSMSKAGWLLVIDLDELVLPRRERNLTDLLTNLRAAHESLSKKPAAFLFRNAFFYQKWKDDPEGNAALETARHTRRRVAPHPIYIRSKYAVRPRYVVELGNHVVWELAPGYTSAGVHPERALLHHYRITCEIESVHCLRAPSKIDRTAHRWSDELYQRIQTEKKLLETDCPSQPSS